jgi:UDP-glucose 4-epimerase
MDIRDPGVEAVLQGVDVLVHLAFVLMRLPSSQDIDSVNVQGTRSIIQAAARQGIRKLVITSSVVAYGMHADNPVPLLETSPLRPNQGLYYSRAKAANEAYYDSFQRENPEIMLTRFRPCTVVGPNAPADQMLSLTAAFLPLVRGANPAIQLVHEQDVASALHLAIINDLPGVYNLTSSEPLTLLDLSRMRGSKTISLPFTLVKILMALTWRTGQSVFAPEWADLSRYSLVADNSKLINAGWKPEFTTGEAFMNLLNKQDILPATRPASGLNQR